MAGVSDFEDLDAWRLAAALRDRVYAMTRRGPAARDFKFRDQIRDSAASGPRNISEGFGRFNPKENANYVRWALGSLNETRNHLLHGEQEGYFSNDDFRAALSLVRRALGATTRYWQYLDGCGGHVPGRPPRQSRKQTKPCSKRKKKGNATNLEP